MLPNRFTLSGSQTSSQRKNRAEGKSSFLPKPKLSRQGSFDRLSDLGKFPNKKRSSSADPTPRSKMEGIRLSRESKIPVQRQRESHLQMTPLANSTYSRYTTTPMRTPSGDTVKRNWQTSLERALAFVTVKDRRPISTAPWFQAEYQRVQEFLKERNGGGCEGNSLTLMRPLNIARFVDIVGSLLIPILNETSRINSTNYVTKLPHIVKYLLYPGTVSKSWLKTVNTLHTFNQALALIAYLVDLTCRVEKPFTDEVLYLENDELNCLRREYLYESYVRFQHPNPTYDDLKEEYIQKLKQLVGSDDEKISQIRQNIKQIKNDLNDEEEMRACTEEQKRIDELQAQQRTLRAERDTREQVQSSVEEALTHLAKVEEVDQALQKENDKLNTEIQKQRQDVETQSMSVAERTRLLEEIDYTCRVINSKQELVHEVAKMVQSTEIDLALWQKNTLSSCLEYNQGLIRLTPSYPDVATLTIDESELMGSDCAASVGSALEMLRQRETMLREKVVNAERSRVVADRRRSHQHHQLEQIHSKFMELNKEMDKERTALRSEREKASIEETESERELRNLVARVDALREQVAAVNTHVEKELHYWKQEDKEWNRKVNELRENLEKLRKDTAQKLQEAKKKRFNFFLSYVKVWEDKLKEISQSQK